MNRIQTRRSPAATGLRDCTANKTRAHTTPSAALLSRLEGVIKTDKGWRARCPAHGGKSASLAIAEADNSTLLVHCFAGCQVHDVLAAVGLQVGDLFVRKDLKSMSPAERSQLRQAAMLPRWRAALDVLAHEATIVLIAADKFGNLTIPDEEEITRLRVAALRIFDAQEVLHAR